MDIEKEYNSLINKTINAHKKHFGLRVKNGFLYKGDFAIYTENLNKKDLLLSFLEGLSLGEEIFKHKVSGLSE